MKSKEIKKKYSDLAKNYNQLIARDGYSSYKKISSWVTNHLRKKKALILDLGCGTGLSSLKFFKKGWDVTGIDLAPGMILESRKLPFKKLICQDLEKPLNVPNEQFDSVVLVGVTEFIQKPLKLFNEVNKKLRDGGLFALTFPKKTPKVSKLGIKRYYKKEIRLLFKKSGFKIIKSETYFAYKKNGEIVHHLGYLLKKE